MNSPFDIDSPYEVMFTDTVEITKANKSRGTVPCCFFPLEDVEPFTDNDTESTIKSANILIRVTDWALAFSNQKIEIGDSVKGLNGITYKIADVTKEQSWFRVYARTVVKK